MDADDRSANDAVCVFVEDEFSEAFSASDAYGATAGNPGQFGDADVESFRFGFGFSHTDPGNFRVGVGHGWDHAGNPFPMFA